MSDNLKEEKKARQEERKAISRELTQRMFHPTAFESFVHVADEIKMTTLRDIFNAARTGFIGDMIEVFMHIEASDARIKGMSATRKISSSKHKGIVTAGSDSDMAEEAAQFVEDNLKKLNFNTVKRKILNGRFYGVALFEKIWARSEAGNLFLKEIKRIDHKRIRQYNEIDLVRGQANERYGELYLVNDFFSNGNLSINRQFVNDINPFKIIKATMSDEDGFYDMDSIMRPVARWYIIKTFTVKAWALFADKYGFPIPVAKVPQSEFEKNSAQIIDLLQSVGANKWAVFFDEFDLDLKEPMKSQTIDVFSKLIEKADVESAIAIVGQNLTSEVTGGSFAASKTHSEILTSIIRDDIAWLDEIINDQIVYDIVRLNFPNLPEAEYPTYSSNLPKHENIREFASAVREISKMIKVPVAWIHEEAQIPEPYEDEEFIGGPGSNDLFDTIEQGLS
jgi:phage gp29-like protein